MLRWRLLLGTVLIAALGALCWLDYRAEVSSAGPAWPGGWLFLIGLLLTVLASGEFLALVRAQDLNPAGWVVYIGSLLIYLSNIVPRMWPTDVPNSPLGDFAWPLGALVLGFFLAIVQELRRYKAPGRSVINLAVAVLVMVYVGVLMSFAVQLRWVAEGAWGLVALLSLVFVVKMGDSGAYTVGRLFGKHKMAPRVSPGKTLEGAAGALLFAVLGSWMIFHLLVPWMIPGQTGGNGRGWVVYGLVIGVAGMVGDLAESLVKRDLGVKDSSHWMPGFGGVLDILDSILIAAPVAYLCWLSGLVGPLGNGS